MRDLTENEIQEVSGGYFVPSFSVNYSQLAVGLGMVGLGVAIVTSAGLATVPAAAFGAAFAGEMVVAGSGLALAGGGGLVMGGAVTTEFSSAGAGGSGK